MTHAWLPRASCDNSCVRSDSARVWRATYRCLLVATLLPALPLAFIPRSGRWYCRVMLRCLGVRITKSGSPIRNVPGVLVVSPHISWVDVLVIHALMPGAFVAKAEVAASLALRAIGRKSVIPIDRAQLRRLPHVVDTVAARLRSGQTVVAFPEGTTWCGLAQGLFRPAMFQAAIDAGRPVQPLRLSYHHRDGSPSTTPAFVGDDTFARSFLRIVSAPPTIAHVQVEELQLPGLHRRDLARRCQEAVGGTFVRRREHALAG